MQKILHRFLPFEASRGFPDDLSSQHYLEWDRPSRLIQISAVTFLTALLYIIFNFLNKSWAEEDVQVLMLRMHFLIVVPLLLTISFLAYKKRFYSLVMSLLAFFPIVSISCHVYIASKLSNNTPFLTEGYLGVFWIFVISGMTYRYALISASLSSTILLVTGFYFIKQPDAYTIHVFWVFCSFSFGILGGFIFDRTRKEIFLSQQELHKLAITDELTGVFNRNKFNHVFAQEIARDHRYRTTLGLLLIDIDHFKNINDSFGHEVGDRVLCKIAQLLSSAIRETDTLVRWGGEEFIVIALDMDEEMLRNFCDKLRQKIEDGEYPVVGKVTVSIGATLLAQEDCQNTMLARADQALYAAKEKGRNTTVTSLV